MAVNIVALILGFIAGVLVYPFFNLYLLAIIAFIGSIAVGVLVFLIMVRLIKELLNT